MKKSIAALVVWLLMLRFTFTGTKNCGEASAFVLFGLYLILAYLYFRTVTNNKNILEKINTPVTYSRWIFVALGGLSILATYEELRKIFKRYPNYSEFSDVLPQLETQYQRFTHGIFPYTPLETISYHPFPAYMPLHWLPIAIPTALQIDIRWCGFFILLASVGIYANYIAKKSINNWIKCFLILFPSVVHWFFIIYNSLVPHELCLPVTIETVIVSYYLILAVGLLADSPILITIGLILCLLSRYTMLFWLPIFALLWWKYEPKKLNFRIWGSVLVAILVFYVFPFCSIDPLIFQKSIAYHNAAVLDEWQGYGENHVSWSMECGVYFAKYFKAILPGEMLQKVHLMRYIQLSLMLLVIIAAYFTHKKCHKIINKNQFSFLFLYLILVFFYFFSPLTYRYYLITTLMLAGIMTAEIWIYSFARKTAKS